MFVIPVSPFAGCVILSASSVVPQGWARCDGQALSKTEYPELFAAIGYNGGSGDTFYLPDLRDRVPVHQSATKPLLSTGGSESVGLTADNLPAHSHPVAVPCTAAEGNADSPVGNIPASNENEAVWHDQSGSPTLGTMDAFDSGDNTTAGDPVSVMQPYVALNYLISLKGLAA